MSCARLACPPKGAVRPRATLALLLSMLAGATTLDACKQETSRTEIVVGVATDLKAPAPLYQVQLTAYRLPTNTLIAEQQFMISGLIDYDYELPGTYAVYSDQGTADRVRLVLVATDDRQQVVVQRTAVLNLIPGKTLFVRMGVVSACMGKLDCPVGDTCIEGRCAPEEIDSSRLPPYTPGLEKQVACTGAVNFVDTSTNLPLTATGTACPDNGWCQDGICLTGSPFAATKGAPVAARTGASQIGSNLTTLGDGSVLLVGGVGVGGTPVLASAETYDPVAQKFTATGSMGTARVYFGEARLPNGRVLIAGGINEGQAALATAELYDPVTRKFTPTHLPMNEARVFPGMVTLTDGRVLVVGGINEIASYAAGTVHFFNGLASAELYDPVTDTFTPTGSLTEGRGFPHVTALPSGGALIMCGTFMSTPRTSLERFDAATGTFGPATPAALPAGETGCSSDVAELRDGRLLVTMTSSGAVWLLDPVAGKFTQAPAPPLTPPGTLAAVLTSGQVLYAGAGAQSAGGYLYDPTSGGFVVVTGNMAAPRPGLVGAALANGDALIVGAGMGSAEVYHAPLMSIAGD